ncbi:MAG: 2-dehydro-3-deoxygalactonokinase [Gammaproteobacteria bacterium]|nr:2-dehydro-3-deoxygalactonokinase [Gammaproteobacteria bacterium]MBU1443865.1 2-dehydro-3-deoxygalactonokinase [Gammaproteobacteria bacterium]MBU2288787.1 2-dehydro-3-deoxygalactonokinase [Gammaproteobacteria bacterium]MBU2409223.1 2-dehydro-3-deoxygalactonokinase [Gammaproteobacteria bacterium]
MLIGIDWGSSNLRVALMDAQGGLIERRESPTGVFAVQDGNFADALLPLCADWLAQGPVPLLACGMIGSRQGIAEVPYVTCPADICGLARKLGRVKLSSLCGSTSAAPLILYIVPGLNTGSAADGWDVLRGEETQLLGVHAGAANLYVLPGTHSKWMKRNRNSQIESFQTYMTGEIFELLRSHSSLGRVMAPANWNSDVFERGVSEARSGALESLLFRVRTSGLMGRFQPDELSDYLSGLLIGAEVKAGLAQFTPVNHSQPIHLLGNAQLTERYALAFAVFGQASCEMPEDAVFNGLLSIARVARLLDSAVDLT